MLIELRDSKTKEMLFKSDEATLLHLNNNDFIDYGEGKLYTVVLKGYHPKEEVWVIYLNLL